MHLMGGQTMTNDNAVAKRHVNPPAWLMRSDGRKKQLEKARWNVERIAEIFVDDPSTEFTVDEIARLVYGSNGKRNRENVRKHIPTQRTYMLSRLIPIITRYGARGRIMSVKKYEKTELDDKRTFLEELDRLKSRKELTDDRYDHMRKIFEL
jgi:hypothetical protein